MIDNLRYLGRLTVEMDLVYDQRTHAFPQHRFQWILLHLGIYYYEYQTQVFLFVLFHSSVVRLLNNRSQ